MNNQQKINSLSEKLKSSNGIFDHEIKVYNKKTQDKIIKFRDKGDLSYEKLAELILKKRGDLNV